MQVKTRNWGPTYKAVSNLVGLKAAATKDLNQQLIDEVARNDGSHGYGRHGAQTGWEAQLIRAATQRTPDQSYDPMGLNPSIRRWNGVMAYSDVDGAPVFDLFGDHGSAPTDHATAAGNISGGFITPEAQFLARARGDSVVTSLSGPSHYAATYLFKTGPKRMRAPINAVHVVVGSPRPGAPYGIGFARRDSRSYRNHSVAFVERLLNAYNDRKTWGEIFPTVDASVHKFHVLALNSTRKRTISLSDLADYLDLDLLWQKTCSLIYRRTHVAATHNHSPWRLITMFPDSLAPGWAPDLWLSDAQKTQLVAQKMNRDVNSYHWTGQTSSFAADSRRSYPVPAWS